MQGKGNADRTQRFREAQELIEAPEWDELRAQLPAEDLEFLLTEVVRIDPPERIDRLSDLEREQAERGAGFHGMLPDQITGPLPHPKDADGILRAATALTEIRKRNLEAIETAFSGDYPLAFSGQDLSHTHVAAPEGWTLDFDLSSFRSLLSYLEAGQADPSLARAIAEMPAFTEMMRHRRELGYVPEPLIDGEGLAWCIEHAASPNPVDRIWRWLNPHNLFDLGDVAAHVASYRSLLDTLEGASNRLTDPILARIAAFTPAGTVFDDRLSFAVGWAIRGWATEATGGINLEHFKDGFLRMLDTLIHETFHRLQTRICRADPSIDGDGFERITSVTLDDPALAKLYTVLAYLMLEGSATYVGSRNPDPEWANQGDAALDLLHRAVRALREDDLEAIDGILNEGLKSNGPFYGFGAWLSQGIVHANGPRSLGAALVAGAVDFLQSGAHVHSLTLSAELVASCERLQEALDE